MSETREQLKKRIFEKIDEVFENHLDNVQIDDEESESFYCKKAFIDEQDPNAPDGKCPEPQELASFDHCPVHTLKIEINYVREDAEKPVEEEDDGIPGEVPKGRPKCFSCCAENPVWLLKKFGIKEGDCHKCKQSVLQGLLRRTE